MMDSDTTIDQLRGLVKRFEAFSVWTPGALLRLGRLQGMMSMIGYLGGTYGMGRCEDLGDLPEEFLELAILVEDDLSHVEACEKAYFGLLEGGE